jgi:PadR family transcriptional regulator PadR
MRRPWSSAGSTSWKPCPSSSQLLCYFGIALLETYLTTLHSLCRVSSMSKDVPRLTEQTLKALGALVGNPSEELSGAEIAKRTKQQSGTLYPILMRLERAAWLESRWEDGDPREMGRPRRRLYRVTMLGESAFKEALREISQVSGGIAWANL